MFITMTFNHNISDHTEQSEGLIQSKRQNKGKHNGTRGLLL